MASKSFEFYKTYSPITIFCFYMEYAIWNVLSNTINWDVSISVFKCNLKLFLLHNELVLNYHK